MIRRAFLLTILVVGMSVNAFAQRPDFAGNWELDRSASRITTPDGLAGLRGSAPDHLYIQQTSDETIILASRLPGALARSYQFDGQTWLPVIEGDPTKILMSSRVRGLSLISTGAGRVAGETVSVREILTMAPSGRTLTLQVTTTRSTGAETNTLIYQRASGSDPPQR